MKSYTHFTLEERESLSERLKEGKSFRKIAEELGRSPSTISREVRRNYSKQKNRYHPWRAMVLYILRRRACVRKPVIVRGTELYDYIAKGFEQYWPPEAIAYKSKENGYSVCCSTIYRAIGKGTFVDITRQSHLRRRGKRRNSKSSNFNTIHPVNTIHDRPQIVEIKERYGDWEGDTVYGGIGKGCIVTLVDRKSKLLAAARSSSRSPGNIRKAFANAFRMLEKELPIHTITLDNGSEFAGFKEIEKDLQTTIYFADPHSPWQRPLNENTNDLIRFFYPKGTNFLNVTETELQSVVSLINNRPRRCLDFLSPIELLSKKCCT